MIVIVAILGLIAGSFLTALTHRIVAGESIAKGRSKCPKCGKEIAWHDNIPVVSYLLLGGKCRNCKKPISLRYPLIEIGTSCIFVLGFVGRHAIYTNLPWLPDSEALGLLVVVLVATACLGVLVVDLEHQIIPDKFVFSLLGLIVALMILGGFTPIYDNLASGFLAGTFLLILNLITRGRGMGMGDVKLALPIGLMLGPLATVVWFFVSFILGGVVATGLLVFGKAGMKDKVAFGPFLIIGFFVCAFFANQLVGVFFPYLQT